MQTIHGTQTSLSTAPDATRDGAGMRGGHPRRTTDVYRPGRAGDRWIERDERTRLRSSRGPNRRAERIDYRTYRLSNVSVGGRRCPAAGSRTYPLRTCPRVRGPVAARCPACPRVARKRHARQTRDEVEDVRPCGCPARHTDRTTVQANSPHGPIRTRHELALASPNPTSDKLMSCPEPPKVLQFTCYSL